MATQVEIAAHLDITDRQVRNLLQSGVLPPSKGRGGYDLDGCRLAYIRHLRGQVNGQVKSPEAGDDSEEFDPLLEHKREQEEYLLTRERRIGQQQKNEIAARKVVPSEFAIFSLSRLSAEIAAILDTLPLTMKRKHPDLEARHMDTLQRELAKARNQAAGLSDQLPEQLNEYHDTLASA
ncbi:terminase small subunit [Halomonas salina]|uniref:DNA packaging protein n=1 Tax=Halomonas salina TaxID=42565 RepID=A0ABR4WUZ6_9GAMM|nr:terminase small subunit [Halomonas salina]KGE78265.1 DNA packaging protein [Halomonas salina]